MIPRKGRIRDGVEALFSKFSKCGVNFRTRTAKIRLDYDVNFSGGTISYSSLSW